MLTNLYDNIHNVLAQGMSAISSDDFETIYQELLALKLEAPAILARQIQQSIIHRKAEKKDVESLIKILQTLYQAETHLIKADAVDTGNLKAINRSVYADAKKLKAPESANIEDIFNIPNIFLRRHQFSQYLKRCNENELKGSIEVFWFDYSLSSAIVEGLREKPDLAISLSQNALKYQNMVIQKTALNVLEAIGSSHALEILKEHLKQSKEPMRYIIGESIARLDGTYDEYRKTQQERFNAKAGEIEKLNSKKKSDRKKAVTALSRTKDPCFTNVLIPLLYDNDLQIANEAPETLAAIGGFDAIPRLADMMEKKSNSYAAAALYKFGDRRGLEYFLSRKLFLSYLERYVSISDFGLLIVNPLLRIIKKVDNLKAYKDGFLNLFKVIRSKEFAQKVIEYLEKDEALCQKIISLLAVVYPEQSMKILKNFKDNEPYHAEAVRLLISETLGDSPNKIITMLSHRYIITNVRISPDGKYAVVLDSGGNVIVWGTDKWKKKAKFSLKSGKYKYYQHQIALTTDGKYLIGTNAVDHAVDIYKFGDWENPVASLLHNTDVISVGATSDDKYILGGGKNSVKVWEFGTWKESVELAGHNSDVKFIQNIPGKKYVITGDLNGKIQIWSQGNWKKVNELKVASLIHSTVAVSHDGKYVAAVEMPANYNQTQVNVWETGKWQKIADLTIQSLSPVNCLSFTHDGKYMIVVSWTVMKFLEIGTWKEVLELIGSDTLSIAVMSDGKHIIAGKNVWKINLK